MKCYFYALIILGFIFYLFEPIPYCNDNSSSTVNNINFKDFQYLKVNGNSMFPTILNDSKCICIKKESYKVNNIILYFVKVNDVPAGILHRINKIDGEKIYPRGDSNNFTESPLEKESIVCSVPYYPRIMQKWE